MFESGGTETTQIGYINRNKQICEGTRGLPGTDHGARSYRLPCLECDTIYGANGSDIFQRKCPNPNCHRGVGRGGIPF